MNSTWFKERNETFVRLRIWCMLVCGQASMSLKLTDWCPTYGEKIKWKREKRKRLRVAGKSYINSKGDLVQERKIGEDCRCRRKCYQIVAEEQRHKLFDGYYALNSHDEQNAYLFGLIRKHDIARKRHKDSDRRTCSYKYFVRIRGKEVQICRLAFAHIHGISPHKIRILCQKQDQNIMFPRDGRGRHENRPRKISEETLNQVRNHIYSIIRSDRVENRGSEPAFAWRESEKPFRKNHPQFTRPRFKPRSPCPQQSSSTRQARGPGTGFERQPRLVLNEPDVLAWPCDQQRDPYVMVFCSQPQGAPNVLGDLGNTVTSQEAVEFLKGE
uniref:Uncharacterized protein n=1 Tax=Timema douglasi TaxID=61478 RepID=A0A7R8VRV0_TIMDO|nr:unnamed protein product [Timema douglasi]